MIKSIRKELPNYLLPSEAWGQLKKLVGKRIKFIKSGMLYRSLEELYHDLELEKEVDLSEVTHGGPIFITIDGDLEHTYVFQSDDLNRSLAFRIVSSSIDSSNFFDEFYREDSYFHEFLRVNFVLDLTDSCSDFIGELIQSVKILKLPDNYYGTPKNGMNVNEAAIVLTFEEAGDLLIAFRMGGISGNGHCLLTWEKVSPEFPVDELVCIREHSLSK